MHASQYEFNSQPGRQPTSSPGSYPFHNQPPQVGGQGYSGANSSHFLKRRSGNREEKQERKRRRKQLRNEQLGTATPPNQEANVPATPTIPDNTILGNTSPTSVIFASQD